jgi:hypothetical protein
MSVEVYAFAGCIAHMMNKVDDADADYGRGPSYHPPILVCCIKQDVIQRIHGTYSFDKMAQSVYYCD